MDLQDLGVAENDMLFSSPKVRFGKIASGIVKQDSLKAPTDSLTEGIAPTMTLSEHRGKSKFWQTLGEHQISPFTPVEE